jgi:hypothetical protein
MSSRPPLATSGVAQFEGKVADHLEGGLCVAGGLLIEVTFPAEGLGYWAVRQGGHLGAEPASGALIGVCGCAVPHGAERDWMLVRAGGVDFRSL